MASPDVGMSVRAGGGGGLTSRSRLSNTGDSLTCAVSPVAAAC